MFDIVAQGIGENLPLLVELNGATFKSMIRLNFRSETLTTLVPKINTLGTSILNVLVTGVPILPHLLPEPGGVGFNSEIWRRYLRVVVNRDPPLVPCDLEKKPGEEGGGHPGNREDQQGCLCDRMEFPDNSEDEALKTDVRMEFPDNSEDEALKQVVRH